MSKKWQADNGFTAIEAIMVIVIIGILATTVAYKYDIPSATATNIAADQLAADIRYVRARAMGRGLQQNIRFIIGSDQYALEEQNSPIEQKKLSGGVRVISTTLPGNILNFNSLGEPTFGYSDQAVTLSGIRTLRIYAITGKVE